MATAVIPAKRRLSAKQSFQHAVIQSLNVDRRLCDKEGKEAKSVIPLKVVGKGRYADVYALGPLIAVKRVRGSLKPDVLDIRQLPPDLWPLYQRFQLTYRQADFTKEEFVAILASEYGIAPHIYRLAVCPHTNSRLLIMGRWDWAIEEDLEAASCARHVRPILPWFQYPLRVWRDLTLKVLDLAPFGIVHSDLHFGNIVVRHDPLSGQPQVALIDFGLAKILWPDSRPTLIETAATYMRLFASWEAQGWFDVQLTDKVTLKTAIDQFMAPVVYDASPDMYAIQRELLKWWWNSVSDIVACAVERGPPLPALLQRAEGRQKRRLEH